MENMLDLLLASFILFPYLYVHLWYVSGAVIVIGFGFALYRLRLAYVFYGVGASVVVMYICALVFFSLFRG